MKIGITRLSAVWIFSRGADGGVLDIRWRSTGEKKFKMRQRRNTWKKLLIYIATALCLACSSAFAVAAPVAAQTSSASNPITVQTIPGPTVTQTFVQKAKTSWPWYIIRGSGLIAAVSLVILILSGIGQITGYTYKFLEPLTAWASHRALGITFGIAVLIHMLTLLFDHFLPFTLWQILVPWASSYKPVTLFGIHLGSLWIALGVLSFYLSLLVVVTSLLWIEKKPHIWKFMHILSYLIIAFVFVHALYIGTDVAHGWVRWAWIGSGVAILAATVHRLWRAYTA